MSNEIFLLAGEASGDLRGAELIRALKKEKPDLVFSGMGGPRMREEGMEILADVSDLAVVGILEVLKHYSLFRKTMGILLDEAERRRPLAVMGVDYPGFNLRFLRKIRPISPKSKTIQFVSPQLWAWHESRKWEMAKFLDLVLCIFPFEPPIYEGTGLRAVYVGHPLTIQSAERGIFKREKSDLLSFFPGSREKEIRAHMPVMRQLEEKLRSSRPGLKVAYAASSSQSEWIIRSFAPSSEVQPPDRLLQEAAAGVVCSGTATLEAALAGLPICVVYRVAWPTYWMGKFLVRVPFLAMPNLLAERPIIKEFIQGEFCLERLLPEVNRLLDDPEARKEMEKGYEEIRTKLGQKNAPKNAAREILAGL